MLGRKSTIIAFAVFGAVIIAMAQPATAANVAISVNSDDTEFQNASTLKRTSVSGSGTSASVVLNDGGYNVSDALFHRSVQIDGTSNDAQGLEFAKNGEVVLVSDDQAVSVFQFNLSDPYNISTATHVATHDVSGQLPDGRVWGVELGDQGTEMYVTGYNDGEPGDIYQYSLSTGYDISTASYTSSYATANKESLALGDSGSVMYTSDGSMIYEYTMSTPHDITSSSQTGSLDTVGELDGNVHGITVKPDGTKLYVVSDFGYKVTSYDLTTPWDLDSAVHNQSYTVSGTDGIFSGVDFSNDGQELYMVDYFNGVMLQYDTQYSTGVYTGQSHRVDNASGAFADISLTNANATVTIQGSNDDSSWSDVKTNTFSTAGNKTFSLSGNYDYYRAEVRFKRSSPDPAAGLSAEGIEFDSVTPTADGANADPQSSEQVNNEDVTLSVPVSDYDFGTVQGDTVTVDFYVNGSQIDSQDISSNQTVSTTAGNLPDASHTWHVVLTESYGESTTSSTWNFDVNHYSASTSSLSPDGDSFNNEDVNVSVQLNDSDFAEDSGDSVDVELFLDGSTTGKTQTVTNNGTINFTLEGLSDGSHNWHVETTDEYGLTSTSSTASFTVNHYAATFNSSSASPSDGTQISSRDANVSIEVLDRDFAEDSGDEVQVDLHLNGQIEQSKNITSNGTVTFQLENLDGGNNTWYYETTDEYGNTSTSQSRTFQVPDKLYIRNVTNTSDLVGDEANETNVTIRFFSTGEDLVVKRTVENGTVNLTGLPVNQEFVVTATADGWYDRRTLIKSVFDQNTIYMLYENETGLATVFRLDDLTGSFQATDTKILIERAVEHPDGNVSWVVVSGDYFGATGEFPTVVEYNVRYRLRVENQNQTRELGAYTAFTSGEKVVTIGEVKWTVDDPGSRTWSVRTYNLTEENNGNPFGYVHFQYRDPSNSTEDLHIKIYEKGNESNILYNQTHPGPYGEYAMNYSINGTQVTEKEWVVKWEATYNGEHIGSLREAAAHKYPVENPFGDRWGKVVVAVVILFTAFMFGGIYSNLGALAVGGVASVLWYMGWYPASAGIILFSMVVAVMFSVGTEGGGR